MYILLLPSGFIMGLIVAMKFPDQVNRAYKLLVASLLTVWKLFIDKCFIRSQAYKTEKGDFVRSKGEVKIANFLYEQKIDYIYEKPLTLSNGKVVHPDFYLTKYDTYVEYFGKLGDKEYNRNIALKKNSYKKDNIRCIELYPNNQNNLENIIATLDKNKSKIVIIIVLGRFWLALSCSSAVIGNKSAAK
mgnify:CR=1 FL=1